MKAGTRVRIVSIHKADAFYGDREALIGQLGTANGSGPGKLMKHRDKRHYMGAITLDAPYGGAAILIFYKVKLERI